MTLSPTDRTKLNALDPNLVNGAVADPVLRKAVFDELYETQDNIITEVNTLNRNLGANTSAFRMRTQVFTATEGQTVFTLTEGSYVIGVDRLQVYAGGVKQYLDTGDYTETSTTSFTLASGVPAGTKVEAAWTEGVLISTSTPNAHAGTHTSGGNDPIDITLLQNYQTEVANKIGNLSVFVNVKAYGADPTGATDSTTAFQNAINAVNTTGGGTVVIPPGTYTVSPTTTTWTNLKSNVNIKGVGASSIIRVKNNNGDFDRIFGAASGTTIQNVTIADLVIDGNIQNNTSSHIESASDGHNQQRAIALYSAQGIHLERIRFINQGSVNIVTINGTDVTDVNIENCYFQFVKQAGNTYDNTALYIFASDYSVIGNYFTTATNGGGVTAFECHNGAGVATGNTVEGFHTGCFIDGGSTSYSVNNIVIANNTFSNVHCGIFVDTPGGLQARNIVISGNTVNITQVTFNITDSPMNVGIGNYYNGNSAGIIENLTIIGNTILFQQEASGGRAITGNVEGIAGIALNNIGGIRGATIIGNVIENAPGRGIAVGASNLSSNIIVSGNTLTNFGQNSAIDQFHRVGIGFVYQSKISDALIDGNILIDNLGRAFYGLFLDTTGAYTRVRVGFNNITKTLANTIASSIMQGVTSPSGATGARPANQLVGDVFFDTTLNKPIWNKTPAVNEVDSLTISVAAASAGNVTVTIGGSSTNIAVLSGDSAATVASKIANNGYSGWSTSLSGSTVTFTSAAGGAQSAPSYSAGTTGATGTMSVSTSGANATWVDATGASA